MTTELNTLDPFDVKAAVTSTSLDILDADPLCQIAQAVAQDVQQLHQLAAQQPRYAALWDQAARASSSIYLNIMQGYGKLRGFLSNDLLCARAEAYETYAALALFPKADADPIKVKVKEVIRLLDDRIRAIPEKHERPAWKN